MSKPAAAQLPQLAGHVARPISPRGVLAGLSLSMLMPSLDTSIANVALPTIAQAFGASFAQVQWVVLAYLLAITTLIVSAGRLGDIVGRRRLLLGGIALFTFASLLCGVAPTLWLLLAARATQGLGAAVMLALAVAIAGDAVGKGRVGSAMGLLGTMSAIGTSLGPSLGGLLIAGFGWRTIFLINVPIGILNLWLALRTLPADAPVAERPGFDVAGTLLLALTLAAYALGMTLGGNGPLLLAAAIGSGLFVAVQARSRAPLIRPAMLRDATLAAGLATTALVSTVMMATLVVGPFYLSGALGLDAASVGMAMSVGPLVAALAGVPSGRLADRFGMRPMAVLGLAGMVMGLVALCLVPQRFGVAGYVGAIAIVSANYALFQAANNSAIMASAGAGQRGVIAGMLSLSRNLGLITGASAMGAVFAFASGAGDTPQAVAVGMRTAFAVAALVAGLALVLAIAAPALKRSGRT